MSAREAAVIRLSGLGEGLAARRGTSRDPFGKQRPFLTFDVWSAIKLLSPFVDPLEWRLPVRQMIARIVI
jgi:hypothetical protein